MPTRNFSYYSIMQLKSNAKCEFLKKITVSRRSMIPESQQIIAIRRDEDERWRRAKQGDIPNGGQYRLIRTLTMDESMALELMI